MRIFVYGTLLNPTLLARFAGRPLPLTPAHLPGWRRVTLRATPYPTLRRAPATTNGALVTINSRTLARLTTYEGPTYRLRRVITHTARHTLPAHTWIAPGGLHQPWQSR